MDTRKQESGRRKLGSHTFEVDEIKHFAERFHPAPEHLSEHLAKDTTSGGLCASGWHVATIAMRLLVRDGAYGIGNKDGYVNPYRDYGPGVGFKNLRWTEIVYANDTVTYYKETLARRPSKTFSGWDVATFKIIGINQNGRQVYEIELTGLINPEV